MVCLVFGDRCNIHDSRLVLGHLLAHLHRAGYLLDPRPPVHPLWGDCRGPFERVPDSIDYIWKEPRSAGILGKNLGILRAAGCLRVAMGWPGYADVGSF